MRFEFQCIPDLPQLAWAARLRKGDPAIQVFHGSAVEIRENVFFDGAWDGSFEDFAFHEASTVACAGAHIRDDHVVFAGPSHMGERFYSIRARGELLVSNSLAFLLALCGERLDPEYPHYYLDFLNVLRVGIKVKEKRLRLLGPGFVEMHDCCNLRIDPDLTQTRLEKPVGPPPRDFLSYRSFLERALQGVIANAGHVRRRYCYRPVTMLSQGYDSTAISALASKAGCREAVTFRRSGGRSGYEDDSGAAIAVWLGLNITEYERMDFERLPQFRPEEFYIDPEGNDRHLTVMEQQLAGSLLLSGKDADNIWPRPGGRHWGVLSETGRSWLQDLHMFNLGGRGLTEFRIRAGFVHFPPGTSGAVHGPVIHAIGRSREMKPWSLGGRYDKPIPRRIAEEAGVPRHLFGQKKKGGPAWPVSASTTWIGKVRRNLGRVPAWRMAGRLLFGDRFDPAWRKGSFAVQRNMEGAIKRYLGVLSDDARPPAGAADRRRKPGSNG